MVESVDNPNLVSLKFITRALQILQKTSNVDLEEADETLKKMIRNFS